VSTATSIVLWFLASVMLGISHVICYELGVTAGKKK